MRKSLLLLPAIVCALSVTAQQKKYYYDSHSKMCDADTARSYVVFNKLASGYAVTQYSLKDEVLMTGNYSSIDSDLNRSREGAFVYYYEPDHEKSEGSYIHNKKSGLWKEYNYRSWLLSCEATYLDDSLDGPYKWYNVEPTTRIKNYEGRYVKGKREGMWKFFYRDSSLQEHTYAKGAIQNKTLYNSDGKLLKKLNYAHDTLVAAQQWDASGAEIAYVPNKADSVILPVFTYVEQMPTATFDMGQYLQKNLVYPRKAQRQKVGGRVVVKFVIDEEGRVSDVTIANSVSPEIDAEAVRVVANMPRWKPGKQNGKVVKVFFNLPIQFNP